MENSDERLPDVKDVGDGGTPEANPKDGCFYTISTLMVLFFLVPAVIGIVLFLLWLIFGD